MENFISVIIPVHNASRTIDACIKSIQAQLFKDFEVILVDDGSSDDSLARCQHFAETDKRLSVIALPHSGVSCARNAGIEKAKGQFILFVDADDSIAPGCLQTLAEAAGKTDIVFFPHTIRYHDGLELTYRLPPISAYTRSEMWDAIHWMKHNSGNCNFFGYTWNKLFRTDIIRQNGLRFIPNLRISEDEVFTADYCLHAQSLCTLSQPLYTYTLSLGGLTMLRNSPEELRLLARCLLDRAVLTPSDTVSRDFAADAMQHFTHSLAEESKFRDALREALRLRKFLRKEKRMASYIPQWHRRKFLGQPLWKLCFTVRNLCRK